MLAHDETHDADAWAELFEAHYRSVYAFLRYRLRGAAEAEDIASQVFEIAYSRIDRFDYRGVPIEGWLIGIARNLGAQFDWHRRIGGGCTNFRRASFEGT